MSNNNLPELTKPEYAILRVLWKKGKQSVREVHDLLKHRQGWALTTTRTVMDRMAKKDLLDKRDYHGLYLYKPLISRPKGLAKIVKFFAERVLETDTNTVVSMFTNNKDISEEEIDELRKLLEEKD